MKTGVLGLDISLTGTGWAYTNGKICYGRYSVLEKDKKRKDIKYEMEFELDRIRSTVYQILTTVQELPKPRLVVIEDFSFSSRGQSLYQIGALQYMIRDALQKRNIDYIVVAPSALKKFVTGKGNCKKDLILKEAYKTFNLDLEDDNIADACGLHYLGMAITDQYPFKMVKHQTAIVSDLKKKFQACLPK